MPVDVTSRYRALQSYEVVDEAGRSTALPARLLRSRELLDVYNHRLTGMETLEYLAWRYFGKSAAWWVVADANELVFPLDHKPGATVKVPPASGVGRVVRTRNF
jgi:hypothetical protein